MRRFLRFRLRTLLVAMTLAAVGLGLWTESARWQRATVRRIRELGGEVRYDFEVNEYGGTYRAPGEPPFASRVPDGAVAWLGRDFFSGVAAVDLAKEPVGAADLDRICALPLLEFNVRLGEGPHGPALGRLRRVRSLNLTDPTDEALAALADLPRLEMLAVNLRGDDTYTDAGVEALRGATQLKFLHLTGAWLTDRSLRAVAELKELESFSYTTRRTDSPSLDPAILAGLTKLQQVSFLAPCEADSLERLRRSVFRRHPKAIFSPDVPAFSDL